MGVVAELAVGCLKVEIDRLIILDDGIGNFSSAVDAWRLLQRRAWSIRKEAETSQAFRAIDHHAGTTIDVLLLAGDPYRRITCTCRLRVFPVTCGRIEQPKQFVKVVAFSIETICCYICRNIVTCIRTTHGDDSYIMKASTHDRQELKAGHTRHVEIRRMMEGVISRSLRSAEKPSSAGRTS